MELTEWQKRMGVFEERPATRTLRLNAPVGHAFGQITIDERASKGMPGSRGVLTKLDIATCAHCQTDVVMNPKRVRPRGYCRKCNAYVCDSKVCLTECFPIKACLELIGKDSNIPALPRMKDGSLLFDRKLLDQMKVY